jgi:hypothetical protein
MDVLSRNRLGALRGPARSFVYRWALAAMILSAYALSPSRVAAQAESVAEYQVKAAFLFNFAKFVDWPESSFADARAPIVIGILGDSPFGDDFDRIVTGQLVKGRTIRISKYRFGDDFRSCHILFISESERARVPQILASLQGASVLTVSDIDGFAKDGGVMQFILEENRVRFAVNLNSATRAKLDINSKLLALAKVIGAK